MTPEERAALYGPYSTAEIALKAVAVERDALAVQNGALRLGLRNALTILIPPVDASGMFMEDVARKALALDAPRAAKLAEARRLFCNWARYSKHSFDGATFRNIEEVIAYMDGNEKA